MSTYVQADRPLAVITPLGEDALLLVGFSGQEAISQLFNFQLDLMAENDKEIAFDKLLGQPVIVRLMLPSDRERFFSGICSRVSQGARDETFTHYRMQMVPQFWLLTRRIQSRIFQHIPVPEILKKVLSELDVEYELQGTFHPRDYCVQYRESDFNFASRLMEEEGIYYFFKHTREGHQMVVANTPQSHPEVPDLEKLIFEEVEGGTREETDRCFNWEKVQELRSGKYTLWDHCFELPHKHLESEQPIQASVDVGEVSHKLKVANNDQLEIYDWPGEYAQRFDGVDKGGGDRPADVQKIFGDNKRTVGIRMQQETVPSIVILGASTSRQLVSGHKFKLDRHFNANGEYVLTSVQHDAQLGYEYRSGEGEFKYDNSFTCIPSALPFRPTRTTLKPTVKGSQTAVVVGPSGEEIFVDKYGRVKVQFHWDREGKADADSSCWIRVAQNWAGIRWGAAFWPRIGHEVVVDFLEGDPDQPIIIGSVFNATEETVYKLPDHKTKSTIKSNTTPGGGGFNEIRFEDKKGSEQLFFHGQKDQDIRIRNDRREWIGNDRHLIVKRDKRELVERDKHVLINRDLVSQYDRDNHLTINGKQAIKVVGSHSFEVSGDVSEKFGKNHAEEAGMEIHLKAGMKIIIEAGAQISLKVGGNFVDISPAGVTIVGTMVNINSGGAPGSGSGLKLVSPIEPEEAEIADNANPGSKSQTYKDQRAALPPSKLAALEAPWHKPKSEANEDKTHWIAVKLVDEKGKGVPGERYRVTLPDGQTLDEGTLDEKGEAKVSAIDPGSCKVTFPDLDGKIWKEK